MRYELSGVETNNKGAELMLYAILQEIERRDKDAVVYMPPGAVKQGLDYVKTKVDIRENPHLSFIKLGRKLHLTRIFYMLHASKFLIDSGTPLKQIDYYLDASGFKFSDQFPINPLGINQIEKKLSGYNKKGTKVVYLPQAFGPVEKQGTRDALSVLSKYSTLIMPREKISYQYLQQANVDMKKVKMFTDFTSLVDGVFPEKYKHLSNGVCIIPNKKMVDKEIISYPDYISLISQIAKCAEQSGHPVYLLNHEGIGDEQIALQCQETLNNKVEVVTGLNALEVKGMIASAYLCISARFHGVASSLNSIVPCLATSWSHKYKELFSDYGISDAVLAVDNADKCIEKIKSYLDLQLNQSIRIHLMIQVGKIKEQTQEMWKTVWK